MSVRSKEIPKALDMLLHPRVYSERGAWKWRRFRAALGKTWGDKTPWIVARNKRLETLDYGPPNIYLETASACNLRCPICLTGAGLVTRKHGFMKPELAEKLAREIQHQPLQVGTWLGGEPLLNPQIAEIVRILSQRGLMVTMHTNATLLSADKAEALIDAGLGQISFSIDGADPEAYERLRAGASFAKTIENVRGFLIARNAKKSSRPRVVIQTVQPWLGEEIHPYGVQLETPPELRALFEGLGVDEFKTIIAHSWSGQMDDNPNVARNHAGIGRRTVCLTPYTDLTIAWDGRAVTCCGDLDAKGVLGDFNRENLYELWNNPNFQALRRDMHGPAIERHPLCGRCERIWTKPHPLDYELRLSLLRYRLRF
jgi:MoaA/NifB/PqqE/SkfB family radical SAM enzyme